MKLVSAVGTAAIAAVAALALAGCGAPPNTSRVVTAEATVDTADGLVIDGELVAEAALFEAAQGQTLSLYSGWTESSERTLVDAFTRDTGIAVNMVRLTPNKLMERVLSEQGAGRLGADIIRISDYRLGHTLEENGVWQPYEIPGAEEFEDIAMDDGAFSRLFNSVYTIAYNTQLVSEEEAPRSWSDMVSGDWEGQIGIVQGGSGGSTAALNRFMESTLGEDYFARYAAQKPTIFDSLGAQATSLARGEVRVATGTVSGTNINATEDSAPIAFIVPEEGVVAYDYYAGIAQGASNLEAAQVFMNYNFSQRGQNVFAQMGEYAARTDVDAPTVLGITLPEIDSAQVFRLSPEEALNSGVADLEKWNREFGYSR